MKIAICEDETYSSNALKDMLAGVLEEHNIAADIDLFTSGEELLSSGRTYNIIFFDCNLPGVNGIDAAKEIKQRNRNVCIIFVSAYPEYSIVGYEASAMRFLVKPVDRNKLTNAIEAYIEEYNDNRAINFNCDKKQVVVFPSEVLYIESVGKKCLVRLSESIYETNKSLDAFEAEITDSRFFRTHRRFIVNIASVTGMNGNKLSISNGESVEISLRKNAAFTKFYNAYLKKEF